MATPAPISYAQWFAQYANSLGLPAETLAQLSSNVTDPTQEAAFGNLLGDMRTIGDTANSARERLAQNLRTGAYNAGLTDYSTVSEDKRVSGRAMLNEADRVTYKVVMGPDGRAYRQAFLNNSAAVGRRSWGGSDDRSTQWTSKQALNAERSRMQNDLTTGQNDTITQQGTDEKNKRNDLLTGIMDYGKWKIGNMPQSPAGQPAAAAGPAPAAAAPAAPEPAADKRFIWHGSKAPNRSAIQNLVNRRYAGRKWKTVRRGDGGYVVKLV